MDYPQEFPKNKYETDTYRCKANWVYFLAEAAGVNGYRLTKEEKEQSLIVSNEILEEVSKQDYPDRYYEYHESCAWAMQHLSEKEDKISKQNARHIIHELIRDYPTIQKREKKEVKFFVPKAIVRQPLYTLKILNHNL